MRPPDATDPDRPDNARAALWLLGDMVLAVVSIALVKGFGGTYPAIQIVFLRASIGLVLLAPWAGRLRLRLPDRAGLQTVRVVLSALALSGTYAAAQALPLALFTTLNFTRPLVFMALACLLLGERIVPRQWAVAGVGFGGVALATAPGGATSTAGLAAAGLAVLAGTGAVIVTRRLKGADAVSMMAIYAGGIALLTAPFAFWSWVSVEAAHWPWLLGIGVLAQGAQACFLRAHWSGAAGVLGPLGYLSLVLSSAVGYLVFAEVPAWRTVAGAAVIVAAALALGGRRPFSAGRRSTARKPLRQ